VSEHSGGHRLPRSRWALEQEAVGGLEAVIEKALALTLLAEDAADLCREFLPEHKVFESNGWVRGDHEIRQVTSRLRDGGDLPRSLRARVLNRRLQVSREAVVTLASRLGSDLERYGVEGFVIATPVASHEGLDVFT